MNSNAHVTPYLFSSEILTCKKITYPKFSFVELSSVLSLNKVVIPLERKNVTRDIFHAGSEENDREPSREIILIRTPT